ncbi:MAG: glycosyltransferase family 2 protein [Chitinispirillaceae bacterium]|nr:glycosyltransferase family 2 protein [Chitinispirillaceae bacterium]
MLTVIVPIYNESIEIQAFHEKITASLMPLNVPWELLYVNDGSTDGSGDLLKNLPGATVLDFSKNRGYGAALKAGILQAKYDAIAIIDCDGTYDPSDIMHLYSEMSSRSYDMVIGKRPHDKGSRLLAKKFLQNFGSYAAGTRIEDLNSGLRVFKKEIALRMIDLLPDGFSFTSTITLGALCFGYRLWYVAISYGIRTGRSKLRPVKSFITFSYLIIRIIILFSPLKFFLPASILFGAVGGIFLVRDIIASNLAQTSMLMLVNAFILFSIGVLAEAIRWKR